MSKIIEVKVVPSAKRAMIKKEPDFWKIYLTAPAVDGKANKALIEYISDYLGIKKKDVHIIKGLKSRYKTISILGNV